MRTKGTIILNNLIRPTCMLGSIDELILEAPVNEEEKAQEILHDSMVDAGRVYLKNVPVVVDVSVGENWSEK